MDATFLSRTDSPAFAYRAPQPAARPAPQASDKGPKTEAFDTPFYSGLLQALKPLAQLDRKR